MLFKAMSGGALAIAALLIAAEPAAAKLKSCVYTARDPITNDVMADGHAKALKRSRACKRAKRRCERELKRRRVLRGTRCKFDPDPPPRWKTCLYVGYDTTRRAGKRIFTIGSAFSMYRACLRAERRCKRKVKRLYGSAGECARAREADN